MIERESELSYDYDRHVQEMDTKAGLDMTVLNDLGKHFHRWLVPFKYHRDIDDVSTIAITVTAEHDTYWFTVIEVLALEHELFAAKSLAANEYAEIVHVAVTPQKYMSWLTTASNEQVEDLRIILQRLDLRFPMQNDLAAGALKHVWAEQDSRPKAEKQVFGRLIASFQEVLNVVHSDASVRIDLPPGWPRE